MSYIPSDGQPCTLPGTARQTHAQVVGRASARVGRPERQRAVVQARKTVQGSFRSPDRPERIVHRPNAPRTSGGESRGFDAGHEQAGRWCRRRPKCAEGA
jgi:hypothetical protein